MLLLGLIYGASSYGMMKDNTDMFIGWIRNDHNIEHILLANSNSLNDIVNDINHGAINLNNIYKSKNNRGAMNRLKLKLMDLRRSSSNKKAIQTAIDKIQIAYKTFIAQPVLYESGPQSNQGSSTAQKNMLNNTSFWSTNKKKVGAGVAGAIAAGTAAYLGKRGYNYWKRRREAKRREALERANVIEEEENNIDGNDGVVEYSGE